MRSFPAAVVHADGLHAGGEALAALAVSPDEVVQQRVAPVGDGQLLRGAALGHALAVQVQHVVAGSDVAMHIGERQALVGRVAGRGLDDAELGARAQDARGDGGDHGGVAADVDVRGGELAVQAGHVDGGDDLADDALGVVHGAHVQEELDRRGRRRGRHGAVRRCAFAWRGRFK